MMKHKQQPAPQSSQSGFTIIESLVALLVAAVLLAAIAPVIVMSAATRLQARRVEQATQAAKTYVDGVRAGVILPPPGITNTTMISAVPAPASGALNCPSNSYCPPPADNLYCFDGDASGACNNNSKDMIVQAFGFTSASTTLDVSRGYQLGVRVYRADGFNKTLVPGGGSKTLAVTAGTGLTSNVAPLVEMTTEIATASTTFDDLCERLKDPSNPDSNGACIE